jgi:hypothetical protein
MIPLRDVKLYERTAQTLFLDIATAEDVSALALTARFARGRGRQAQIETALTYVSAKRFALAISAADTAVIQTGWVCDICRDDTGAPVVQLNLTLLPVVR